MVRPPNPLQGHESFQYPSPGPSSVLEYQASGLPYVTGSSVLAFGPSSSVGKIEFPFVTKFFTVKNNGPDYLYVGFTRNGVLGSNYLTLVPSSSYTGEIRLADLFLTAPTTTASYEVIAGLTQIPRRNWFILTGALDHFSGTQAQILAYGVKGFGYDGLG